MDKPRLPFWQIWNMSFGFLGIQFGWGLQMANMSAVYEYLGATPSQIPMLWLAAPLTGLIVQPIIGRMSDRTWGPLGRRRPYFLAGAIASSIALLVMPNASSLWMAAGLLWILDASINISMEPFRAFVADMLPEEQQTGGFAMQSLFIGLGAVIASALPFLLTNLFHVSGGEPHAIPHAVRLSFYMGAVAFIGCVLWTILKTKEYPPDPAELEAQRREAAEGGGIAGAVAGAREIVGCVIAMPAAMRQLAWVQLCTWFGLFRMWLYFPVAVAHNVFGATDTGGELYRAGVEWAGLCFSMYSAVCFAFSFVLPILAAKVGRRTAHSLCLALGALGLLSVAVIHDKYLLLVSMTGIGMAWASILSMPYAMLARSLPPGKTGVYMGIFNFFIVIPEIAAALGFGWLMEHVFDDNRLAALVAGGAFMMIAAVLAQRVEDGKPVRHGRLVVVLALVTAGLGVLALTALHRMPKPPTVAAEPVVVAVPGSEPIVEKVEPPSFWAGHTINPVRLLIRGSKLGGASIGASDGLTVSNVRVNASATYVFADVAIDPGAAPGARRLTLATPSGKTVIPFEVLAPLPDGKKVMGFGADDVIYQIMPDRFADGDASNDEPAVAPGLTDRAKSRYYHGGDFQGIIDHLPYLSDMGMTAIWMTPVYDNSNKKNDRETYDGEAITDYHGYGAVDLYGVEEHFGTMAKLKELCDAAHRKNIKVIIDQVANHVGPYHPWATNPPSPTWLHGTEKKHRNITLDAHAVADAGAPEDAKRGVLDGWFVDLLPDLNQDDEDVARYEIQNTLWWIGMAGFDGIRQDTLPYVPRTFWRDWMAAIKRQYPNFNVVGEMNEHDVHLVSFYQGGKARHDGVDSHIDALFDFPMVYRIRSAFAEGKSMRELTSMLENDSLYVNTGMLVTFAGLHDMTRFMNEPGATTVGLELAETFLFTERGIPMIYYGDEIAMKGGEDPDNRRDFPGEWTDADRARFQSGAADMPELDAPTAHLRQHVKELAHLRAALAPLRHGTMNVLAVTDQTLAFARVMPDASAVVVLNNGANAAQVRFSLSGLNFTDGATLEDRLGKAPDARVQNGVVQVALAARSAAVYTLKR